jgi:adenylate cyclase
VKRGFPTAVYRETRRLQEDLERLQIERLRLIGLLEEHLSPDLVAELLSGTRSPKLGGRRATVGVLFCDLRGFTRFTATEDPDEVVRHLNQFFHAMTTALFQHGATVDKFIGDAILAFFKRRGREGKKALAARVFACASEMRERFESLSGRWRAGRGLGLGMGLSLGEVILGHVGSGKHVDFTVIGRPVNLAARLCAVAGAGEILVPVEFRRLLGPGGAWDEMPPQSFKGFDEPVTAYALRSPIALS